MIDNPITKSWPTFSQRLQDCVHCGFCLPACPTYQLWGQEADSPRGRIHLMKQNHEGIIPMDSIFKQHIDACLGCMSCVSACPSGVRYDELIEHTRASLEDNYQRPPFDRAFRKFLFSIFPYPKRVRVAAVMGIVANKIGANKLASFDPRLKALTSVMPDKKLAQVLRPATKSASAKGDKRLRVGILSGCVQRVYFSQVNQATIDVLTAEGIEVVSPTQQNCCGALEFHSGEADSAIEKAKLTIEAFEKENVDAIVVNAAGCGSSMKDYGRLLADDPIYAQRALEFSEKVEDISEFLSRITPRAKRNRIDLKVAYQDPCHLLHAQQISSQPRKMILQIPGIELIDLQEPNICCGSAGIYNLVEPETGAELGRRKAVIIKEANPQIVASANPGCTLQLQRYLDKEVKVIHWIELLQASILNKPLV